MDLTTGPGPSPTLLGTDESTEKLHQPATGENGVASHSSSWEPWPALGVVAVVAVLAVGIFARLASFSHLWLDEAQTVNIASLPLDAIPEALRHDGSPPLYYYLLHAWIDLVGTGDTAVRVLSGLFAVASLPLAWMAGHRLGGRRVAWIALVLFAVSPFAIRQATEVRMYSLVIVLALTAWLALDSILFRAARWRAGVVLAASTGLVMLTHYWSFFLVAIVVAVLGVSVVIDRHRAESRRALLWMGAGSLLFLPWVPSFLYQLGHTGTPWGRPGSLRSFFDTTMNFAGGYDDPGLTLGILFFALIALGLTARAIDGRRLEIDLGARAPGRRVAAVAFGGLVMAIVAGRLTGSAFAVRYTAVIFPFVLLLVALGVAVFADKRVRTGLLVVIVGLSLWAAAPSVFGERTAAVRVAQALERRAEPGDVVAYCPDQLGPSVSRLLSPGFDQVTFPAAGSPELVDWVDYRDRNRAGRPAAFAELLDERAGPGHDVWIVWAPGYRTFSTKCQALVSEMEELRPDISRVVTFSSKYFEKAALVRYRPA